MDELTLDRLLQRAPAGMAYPATPRLRAAVLVAIGDMRPAKRGRVPAFALAATAALATVVALVALPGSRSAVADFFGIEGSDVKVLPTAAPDESPTPFPTAVPLDFIATPVSLDAAAAALGYTPALPAGEGPPERVYLLDYFDLRVAIAQYARFDLWQTRTGEIQRFEKGVLAGSVIEELTIGGQPARWIAGGDHIVRYIDGTGREVAGSQRTVTGNTLIWRTAYAFYRIETDLPLADARKLAESLP